MRVRSARQRAGLTLTKLGELCDPRLSRASVCALEAGRQQPSSLQAQQLADALNVRTDHLNPLEGLSQADIDAGVTYVSAQRENIDKIATALGCA